MFARAPRVLEWLAVLVVLEVRWIEQLNIRRVVEGHLDDVVWTKVELIMQVIHSYAPIFLIIANILTVPTS